MLINPEDAVRMLRDDWGGPGGTKMLSEELYAIFTDQGPATMQGPAAFSNPGGTAAPITVTVPALNGSFPAINFVGPQGQPAGSLTIDNGVPQLQSANGQQVSGGGTVKSGSNSFIGTVVSGTGVSYQVQLTITGLTVAVTQLQINASATIPAGTKVIVVKESNGQFYMQSPVWL